MVNVKVELHTFYSLKNRDKQVEQNLNINTVKKYHNLKNYCVVSLSNQIEN